MIDIINEIIKENDYSRFRYSVAPFDNQFLTALNIFKAFSSTEKEGNYVILNGLTQSGKTGVLCAMLALLSEEHRFKIGYDIEKVMFITGNDSIAIYPQLEEDLEDTKFYSRMFSAFKRSDLKNDKVDEEIKHTLIFIDESHYGTKEDGKSGKKQANILQQWLTRKHLDLKADNQNLSSRNVYIVSCSATPWEEEYNDKRGVKEIVDLIPGEGYIGYSDFFENMVGLPISPFSAGNVTYYCHAWHAHLKKIEGRKQIKKCAIVRINKNYENYKHIYDEYFDVILFDCNSKTKKIEYDRMFEEIVNYKNNTSNKYLMIAVKNGLNMAIRIAQTAKIMIGVICDYASDSNIVATTQGLLGRICGYYSTDDWKDIDVYINEKHKISLEDMYETGKMYPKSWKKYKKKVFIKEKVGGNKKIDIKILDDNIYCEYPIQKFLIDNIGKKLGNFDNFQIDYLVNKNNKTIGIAEIALQYLRSVDDWYCDDIIAVDTRRIFNDSKGNKTHDSGKIKREKYYNDEYVGKKIIEVSIDVCDINNIKLFIKRGNLAYYIEKDEYVNSQDYFKQISAYSTETQPTLPLSEKGSITILN